MSGIANQIQTLGIVSWLNILYNTEDYCSAVEHLENWIQISVKVWIFKKIIKIIVILELPKFVGKR